MSTFLFIGMNGLKGDYMKKVYYEEGPDQLWVGPVTNQTLIRRGKENAVSFDDKFADLLLKKPRYKEDKSKAVSSATEKEV